MADMLAVEKRASEESLSHLVSQLWTHNGVSAVLCLGGGHPGVVRLGAPPALHFGQALLRAPLPPLQLQRMGPTAA